jgi:hypothetical protein
MLESTLARRLLAFSRSDGVANLCVKLFVRYSEAINRLMSKVSENAIRIGARRRFRIWMPVTTKCPQNCSQANHTERVRSAERAGEKNTQWKSRKLPPSGPRRVNRTPGSKIICDEIMNSAWISLRCSRWLGKEFTCPE